MGLLGLLFLIGLISVLASSLTRYIRNSTQQQVALSIESTSQLLNLATVPYTNDAQIHVLQDYLSELVGEGKGLLLYVVIESNNHYMLQAGQVPKFLPPPDDLKKLDILPTVIHIRQPILFNDSVGFLQYGYQSASLQRMRNELIRHAIVGMLFVVVVAVALLTLLGHRVGTRLQNMIDVFQAIAEGDYSRRVPVDNEDELSRLAMLFNRMTDAVEERWLSLLHSRQEIEALNNTLEQKVERRTQELRSTNGKLQEVINDLKKTQSQLVESEKQAALGQMVAGIAHELNTPLGNTLTIATSMDTQDKQFKNKMVDGKISRKELELLLDSHADAIDILLRNLSRATTLINSFKQVAVDQVSDNRRQFRLGKTLEEILLSLEPSYRKRKVQVLVEHADPLVELDSFPGALVQIISNFINNALMHAFDGVDSPQIQISTRCLAQGVEIQFRDNGCGIPQHHLNRIFEPFFTTKLGQGGSGLGLHICYNLITARLGGSIQVQSSPGEGTCFSINIPLQAPERTAPPPESNLGLPEVNA